MDDEDDPMMGDSTGDDLNEHKMVEEVDAVGKRIMKDFDPHKQSYFKNVAGSVKSVANDYLSTNAPNAMKTIDVVSEFRSEAQKYFRDLDLMKTIHDRKSGVQEGIKDMFKNTFKDLKSGDFAGTKRIAALNKASNPFGDFDDDFDFSFDDDDDYGGGSSSTDVGEQIGAIESAASTMAEATGDLHARSEVSANSRHVELTAFAAKQTDFLSKITNVQEEYMTPMSTSMQAFTEKATPALSDMADLMKDISANTQRSNAIEVWRATNTAKTKDDSEKTSFEEKFEDLTNFDIASAKDNIKGVIGGSDLMEAYRGVTEEFMGPSMIKKFIASPLGTLLPMMMPKGIGKSLGNLDSLVQSLVPKAVMGLTSYGQKKGGIISKLTGALGYNGASTPDIDLATTENLPSSWASDDSTSLRVVIPTLLGEIKSAIDGSEPSVWDYRAGHFKTKRRVKAEYEEERDNIYKGSMTTKAFGDMMSMDDGVAARHGIEKNGANQKLLKLAYGNIAKNALNLNTLKADIHDEDPNTLSKLMEGYDGDLDPKAAAKRINTMLQVMDDSRYNDLYGAVMNARKKAPKRHGNLADSMVSRGLTGAIGGVGWDGSELDNEGNIKVGNKTLGATVQGGFTKRIYDLLVEGIGTFQIPTSRAKKLKGRLSSAELYEVRKQRSVQDRIAESTFDSSITGKELLEEEKRANAKQEQKELLEGASNAREYGSTLLSNVTGNIKSRLKQAKSAKDRKLQELVGDGDIKNATLWQKTQAAAGGVKSVFSDMVHRNDSPVDYFESTEKTKMEKNTMRQARRKKKRKGYATGGFVEGQSGQDNVDAELAGGEVVLSHKHLLTMSKMFKIYDKHDNDEDRIRETGTLLLAMGGKTKYKDGLQSMGEFKVNKGMFRTKMKGNGSSVDMSGDTLLRISRAMGIHEDFKNDDDRIKRTRDILQNYAQNGGEVNDTSRTHSGAVRRRNRKKDNTKSRKQSRMEINKQRRDQRILDGNPSTMDKIKSSVNGGLQKGFNFGRDAEIAWRSGNLGEFAKEKFTGAKEKAKEGLKKGQEYGKFYLDRLLSGDLKGMMDSMIYGTTDKNGNKVKKGILDKVSETLKSVGSSIKKWSDKHLMGDKTETTDENGKKVVSYEGGFFSPLFQFGSDLGSSFKEKFFGENGVINKAAAKLLDGFDNLMGKNSDMAGMTISERLQAKLFGGKGEKFGGILGSMKRTMLSSSKHLFGNLVGFKGYEEDGKRGGGLLQYIGKDILGKSAKDLKSIITGDRYKGDAKRKKLGEKSLDDISTDSIRGRYGDDLVKKGMGRDVSFKEIAKRTKEKYNENGSGMPTVDYITANLKHSLIDNLVAPTLEVTREFKDFSKAMLVEAQTFMKKSLEFIRSKSMDIIGYGFKYVANMIGNIPVIKRLARGLSDVTRGVTGVAGKALSGVASFMRNKSVKTGTLSVMEATKRAAGIGARFKSKEQKQSDKLGDIRANIKRLESNKHLTSEEKKKLKEAKKYVSEYDLVKKERKMSRGEETKQNIIAAGRRQKMMNASAGAKEDYQKYVTKQEQAGVSDSDILSIEDWSKKSKYGKFLTDEYQNSTLTVANRRAKVGNDKKAAIVDGEIAAIKSKSPELAVADDQLDEMKKQTSIFERMSDMLGGLYDQKIGGMSKAEVKKKYDNKAAERIKAKAEAVEGDEESPDASYDESTEDSASMDDSSLGDEPQLDMDDYDFNTRKGRRAYKKDSKKLSTKGRMKVKKKLVRKLKKLDRLVKKSGTTLEEADIQHANTDLNVAPDENAYDLTTDEGKKQYDDDLRDFNERRESDKDKDLSPGEFKSDNKSINKAHKLSEKYGLTGSVADEARAMIDEEKQKKADKKTEKQVKKKMKLDTKASREFLKAGRKKGLGAKIAEYKYNKYSAKSESLTNEYDLGSAKAKEMETQIEEKREYDRSLLGGIKSMASNLQDSLAKKGWLRMGMDKISKFGAGLSKLLSLLPLILGALGLKDIFDKFKKGDVGTGIDKSMQLVSSMGKYVATKFGAKAGAKRYAAKFAEEGAEKVVKKSGVKTLVKKALGKVLTIGPLKGLMKGGAKEGVEATVKAGLKKAGPKVLGKLGAKLGGAMVSGGATLIATAGADYLVGTHNAPNYFELGPGQKPTKSMKRAAGAANAISGAMFGLAPSDSIAKLIYSKIASPEEQAGVQRGQAELTALGQKYGIDAEHKKGMNNVVNKTFGGGVADFFTTKANETERKMKMMGMTDKGAYYAFMQDQEEQKILANAQDKGWTDEEVEKKLVAMRRKYSELGDLPIMTKLSSAIGNITGNVGKFFGNIPKMMTNGLKGIARGIIDTVKGALTAIGGIKDIVFEKLGQGIDWFKDKISPFTDMMKKVFSPITDFFGKFVGENGILTKILGPDSFIHTKLESLGIFKIKDQLVGLFGGIGSSIKKMVKEKLGIFGKWINTDEELDKFNTLDDRDNVDMEKNNTNKDGSPKRDQSGAKIHYVDNYNDELYKLNIKARDGKYSAPKYAGAVGKLDKKYAKYQKKGKVERLAKITERYTYEPADAKDYTYYDTSVGGYHDDKSPTANYGDVTARDGNITTVNFNQNDKPKATAPTPSAIPTYEGDITNVENSSKDLSNRVIPIKQAEREHSYEVATSTPQVAKVVEDSLKLIVDMMDKLLAVNVKILESNATSNARMVSISSGVPAGSKPVTGLSQDDTSDLASLRNRAQKLVSGY